MLGVLFIISGVRVVLHLATGRLVDDLADIALHRFARACSRIRGEAVLNRAQNVNGGKLHVNCGCYPRNPRRAGARSFIFTPRTAAVLHRNCDKEGGIGKSAWNVVSDHWVLRMPTFHSLLKIRHSSSARRPSLGSSPLRRNFN